MEITRAEFRDALTDLKSDLREDLTAIREHLATLNGRTLKGEIADAELRARVTGVEKEVFARPHRRTSDHEPPRRLSPKDMALGGIGLTLLAGAIKLLLAIGEFGLELLKATVKHG